MMIFYHGTTDVFNIKKILSASKFARKACGKYGGNPVVYEVKPIGQYFNTIYGEYISERAMVVGIKWQSET